MVALVGEERGHSGSSTRSVVESEFREGEQLGPVVLLVVDVCPEILLQCLIGALRLSVRLWVVT